MRRGRWERAEGVRIGYLTSPDLTHMLVSVRDVAPYFPNKALVARSYFSKTILSTIVSYAKWSIRLELKHIYGHSDE